MLIATLIYGILCALFDLFFVFIFDRKNVRPKIKRAILLNAQALLLGGFMPLFLNLRNTYKELAAALLIVFIVTCASIVLYALFNPNLKKRTAVDLHKD